MPKEVFNHTLKKCKKNSTIGLLATEGTLRTGVYNEFFDKKYNLICPNSLLQKKSVNKAIKLVKMGDVKTANKIIKPAIDFLIFSMVCTLHLGSGLPELRSWIQNPGSWIPDPRSQIWDPRIRDLGSRIPDLGFGI